MRSEQLLCKGSTSRAWAESRVQGVGGGSKAADALQVSVVQEQH